MTKTVEVVAIEDGHDGRFVRKSGERFHVAEDRLNDGSTWFVLPENVPDYVAAPKSDRPPGAGPVKGSAVDEGAPGKARK